MRPWGEMFLIPSGYIGLAPVSDTLINVSVVVRAAHLAATKKTSQAFFAQTVQAHPELRQRFAQAVAPHLTVVWFACNENGGPGILLLVRSPT